MSGTAISNEELMALADGEVREGEAAALHARVAKNVDLASRYAMFVETRALAQRAPLSRASAARDSLADKIRTMGQTTGAGSGARQESADALPRLRLIGGRASAPNRSTDTGVAKQVGVRGWRLPLAASLIFAIGGVAGYVLAPRTSDGLLPSAVLAMPAAQAAIERALSRTASGEEIGWSDPASGLSGRIVMVATHRLEDGAPCREYEVTASGETGSRIVAASCRREGKWRTEIAAVVPAAGTSYAPASGVAAVEQYLGARGSTGPLGPQEERGLIDSNWPSALRR